VKVAFDADGHAAAIAPFPEHEPRPAPLEGPAHAVLLLGVAGLSLPLGARRRRR
jgi:hypothetical protein